MSSPKSRIIILEGPDGGGKTTLANELRDKFEYTVIHFGQPTPGENIFRTYSRALLDAIDSGSRIVFDRLYLSEVVYSNVLRGGSKITLAERKVLEYIIDVFEIRQVLCLPEWPILLEGWRSKEDLIKSQDTLARIYDGYVEEVCRPNDKHILYQWNSSDPTYKPNLEDI